LVEREKREKRKEKREKRMNISVHAKISHPSILRVNVNTHHDAAFGHII